MLGDFVRDISVTDITVTDTVFTGLEASPDVTVTYDGKTLENGVDYKVIYDGSSDPGSAYLTVFGIGDFCGALDLTYTITDSLEVKVDGAAIGEEYFTIDEETGAVTLTEEYLRTLAVGDHILSVVISGAETTTDFTVDPVGYKVTEGADAEWAKDCGKDLSFGTDAEAGRFTAVRIDGTEVEAESFTVGEDGTVTLKEAFLKTLSDGAHALTLVFSNGEASARFTVLAPNDHAAAPQTGDGIGLWIILMSVSAVCFILLERKHRAFVK